MDKEETFTKIEDDIKKEINNNEEKEIQNSFNIGLPSWDLEPPYEPIKRGNRE